jgi:hypothetical protein
MHERRVVRLDTRFAESVPLLFTNEIIGLWFRLPYFVIDDVDLMDALREPLSRRICLADTFLGPLLIGLEDVWAGLFYSRSWLNHQVEAALKASRR